MLVSHAMSVLFRKDGKLPRTDRAVRDLCPHRRRADLRARVAWRNSSRCIGRLYWRSLRVRDRRHITAADQVAAEAFLHLREATNSGRVRPTLTVFAADRPERPGPWIWNEQLIRYAGYRQPDGTVVGDPRYADFTDRVRELGWPGGPGTPFDVLPLVVQSPGEPPGGSGSPRTRCSRSRSATPATSGSPTSSCAGTPSPPSPTSAWRSVASATRRRRQRLVHGHRDRRPQPGRRLPL
jgi:Nitric oxide synthase, oxygenase domain